MTPGAAIDPAARADHPVLVPEVQASGMIGVIRSLGRAGYPVHACAADRGALGLASRYVHRRAIHPAYGGAEFVPWLRRYVTEQRIAAIVPSEGFLLALGSAYDEFANLLPDPVPHDVAQTCLSKALTTEVFQSHPDASLREDLPASWVLRSPDHPLLVDSQVRLPLVVKTDAGQSRSGSGGWVRIARDAHRLAELVRAGLQSHHCVLIQEMVPGVKATVNLFVHQGEIRAESMCVASHENPHDGGLTTYRRTWWHEAMAADARRRVKGLGWQGVAMVEYKWDETTGRYWFIEINSRYWAALNMDLLAGTDFPRLQLDARLGGTETALGTGRRGYRCRYTFPADAGHLISLVRDPRVTTGRKWAALAEAVWLSLDPRVGSDLWFPGDRGLYLRALGRFLSRLGRS